MRISSEFFKEQASELLRKSKLYAIGRAHLIMCERYCDKMTLRNLCPLDCNKCALMLKENAQMQVEYGTPYAMFTWRMKNAFAKAAEASTRVHRAVIPQNAFGERIEVDAFD